MRGGSAGSQVPAAHQTPRPQAGPPGPRCTGPSPARPGRWVLGGTEATAPVAWARPSAAQEPSPAVRGAGRGRYLEDALGPDSRSNGHPQLRPLRPRSVRRAGSPAPSRQSPLQKARVRISCPAPQSSSLPAPGSTFCLNKKRKASNQHLGHWGRVLEQQQPMTAQKES